MPTDQRLIIPPFRGINTDRQPHEIDTDQLAVGQDALVDHIGFVRRRGPLNAVTNQPTFAAKGAGLVQTFNPAGSYRAAAVIGDGTVAHRKFQMLAANLQSVNDTYTLPNDVSETSAFWTSPNPKGGVWVSVYAHGQKYLVRDRQAQLMFLWKGAIDDTDSGGTTITATRGSRTVTGAGSFTGLSAGMFLFAEPNDWDGVGDMTGRKALIGVVHSVSGANIVLEEPALATVAAGTTASFRPVRPFMPRVATGTITCATTAATVEGGDTRFKDAMFPQDTSLRWRIFRARDLTRVGDVETVTDNTSLTLGANAAIAMDSEFYIAIQLAEDEHAIEGTTNPYKPGWLTAYYAGRQWFASGIPSLGVVNEQAAHGPTFRLWFSTTLDPESIDLFEGDANWLEIGSHGDHHEDPIIGLYPTYAGLLIFKPKEVYLLSGDGPDTFNVHPILSTDGLLAPMTILPWEGGVVWAGFRGIWLFDGTSPVLLSEDLGRGFRNELHGWSQQTYGAWAIIHKNHYILHVENTTSRTWILNLDTGGWTTGTNLRHNGGINLPESTGHTTWMLVNSSTVANLANAETLFTSTGDDAITSSGAAAGPDFNITTGRLDCGDPMMVKFFDSVYSKFLNAGGTLIVKSIPGIETTTKHTSPDSPLAADVDTTPTKRARLHKRSTHLALEFTEGANVTDIKIPALALTWRAMRASRRGSGGGMV